jgi:RimJ/RimL family protein N-acetyltransferase
LSTPRSARSVAPIDTERLRLRPYSPADLVALIDGTAQFEQRVGFPIADGVREFLVSGEVSPVWLEKLRQSAPGAPNPWAYGYGVIDRASNSVVGTAGFKGPPNADGVVEIAYGIAPSHEGRGYATEVAGALVDFAFSTDAVRVVRAHTLPSANASTRVLTKCGFAFLGEVEDPEDGRVWRWERPKDAISPT